MKLEHWKLIRKVSAIYLLVVAILLVADIAVLSTVDYGLKSTGFVGCYAYDSLLVGFECTGFVGAKQIATILSFPLFHLYMPFFALFNPVLAFVVVALWFFPVMFVISIIKLGRKSSSEV